MADISQVTLLDGSVYNLKDAESRSHLSYVVPGTSITEGVLSGQIPVTELRDGLVVTYIFPVDASGEFKLNLTFQNGVNTSGAIQIYGTKNNKLSGSLSAGATLTLVYFSRGAITINGYPTIQPRWICTTPMIEVVDLGGDVYEEDDEEEEEVEPIYNPTKLFVGTGETASDKGASASPHRYHPAKWTFNTGVSAVDGRIFTIKVPCAGHSYGVYMSVDNGENYYPVVTLGATRLTTHYAIDTYIQVIFQPTGSADSMRTLDGSDAAQTITGGVWRVLNYYDSNSNTIPSAYCTTAAATTAKTASCTGYVLTNNSYLHVLISVANTSKNRLTLNVNSKGAKPIYINGTISSATNYTLPASTYIVYYDGTGYHFRTDGKIPMLSDMAYQALGANISTVFLPTTLTNNTPGNYVECQIVNGIIYEK